MAMMIKGGRGLPMLTLALLCSGPLVAQEKTPATADDDNSVELEAVEVSAAEEKASARYADKESGTATGLSLSPRQTPQSVSTVTRERMDDFGLDDINEVLETTTGVTVEKVETDRTYYTSRGFDVSNFLRDGVGVPFVYHANVLGDIDTAIYQEIEVLRGANGLIGGTGNPAATVNFIRKRPTEDFNAAAGLTMGAWSRQRLDADISGSLNDDGGTRGRLVAAYQDGDSWLDRYSQERSVFYGVVEQDLTDSTLLTLGHSYQNVNSDSPMWGALPLYRTDGSPTDYDRSTSTSSDWSYWDNVISTTFAELRQQLGGGWSLDLMLEHQETDSDSELFYVYGTPDPNTAGSDLFAYPSAYEKQTTQQLADLRVKGPFELGGRMHELVTGVNYWEVELEDESNYGQGIGTEIVPLEEWNGRYPKPAFTAGTEGSDLLFREKSAFAASRFSLTDSLSLIGGAKVVALDYNGESYGTSRATEYDAETVPYGGIVYDINHVFSVYASHAETFSPQTEVDVNRDFLDPVSGTSQEAGIKAEIPGSGGALFSLAAFEVEQDNVAEQVGTFGNGDPYYEGRDGVTSTGWELSAQGEVLSGLQLAGGYTHMNISNPDGSRAKPYVPEKMLRLSSVYDLPAVPDLKVGASVKWQDDVCRPGKTICQEDYTLVGLMGQYQLNERVKAQLNVYNLTDEKYINSLYWDQGYYGAPRHAELSLEWRY